MKVKASLVILTVVCCCATNAVPTPTPKSLTVNCQSLGDGEEFKNRLMVRQNAEDQTTIWLKRGEELSINFDLPNDATVEVLDLRYSNDGDYDEISINMDGKLLGGFKTSGRFAWGQNWNLFTSSGPVGGPQKLKAGLHAVTLKVLDADVYGVEIDYIRINVHGAAIHNLDQEHFICVHKPGQIASPKSEQLVPVEKAQVASPKHEQTVPVEKAQVASPKHEQTVPVEKAQVASPKHEQTVPVEKAQVTSPKHEQTVPVEKAQVASPKHEQTVPVEKAQVASPKHEQAVPVEKAQSG